MIDGLKPYPSYKASGLPWLGETPKHWDVRRAKYFFREADERSTTGEEELLSVSHITGVTPRSQKNITMFLAESNVGHKLCEPGDVVVNTMWAWMAALGVARQRGIVSPSYAVYRPISNNGLLPEYVDRLLRTPEYSAEYLCASTGINTSRLRLYPEQFLRIPIIRPPQDEQALIVRFLDHADRPIRRYTRDKKRLIALLNEQKRAITHHAVTRGLDENPRLKPSGVQWLGDVPESWDVVPFKRRVGFQEGPGIMASDFRDEGVPLLRISCLRRDTASLEGCNFLAPEMVRRRWSHFAVRAGDYLLSASASTGNVVLATDLVAGAIPYTGILRLWALGPDTFMPFVRLYVSGLPFQEQIDAAKSGVAIEHFGPTHLSRMFIALPSRREQEAIVRQVEEHSAPLEEAIERADREIALLREYRTRLVADIVTGKIDVRLAAADLPTVAATSETEEVLPDEAVESDTTELDDTDAEVTA